MTGASKSSNIGPIVGGVIAGVLIIVAIIAIILWRRRSPTFIPTNKTEKALLNAAPEALLGSVRPFVLHPSQASPVEIPGPNSVDALPSLITTNQAGSLPKKFTQMETLTLGDTGPPSSTSNTTPARAELLRQERERINREIASLENRSTALESRYGGSSYDTDLSDSSSHPMVASVAPVPIGSSIHDQLASLREQIRQIEQVYGPRASGMSDDPPPGYDAPPSGTIIGSLRPLPNVMPPGESSMSAPVPRPNPKILCPIGDREEG